MRYLPYVTYDTFSQLTFTVHSSYMRYDVYIHLIYIIHESDILKSYIIILIITTSLLIISIFTLNIFTCGTCQMSHMTLFSQLNFTVHSSQLIFTVHSSQLIYEISLYHISDKFTVNTLTTP